MNLFDEITKEAQAIFQRAKGSHDWDHTERVLRLSLHIGEKEGADLEVVAYAAILHDIGRAKQDLSKGKICHAEAGAVMAREILEKYSLWGEKVNQIIHCIEAHRFRKGNPPQTKEARVLYDADKLDAIGAIGIGRAFVFSGEIGARVHNSLVDVNDDHDYTKEDTAYREYLVKLSKIKDKILTNEGRRIAEDRHAFMEAFFDRLNKEAEGEL